MHRLYYDLTRNMRREHMCDDSGYVQDERATACFATGNSSDPSALLPGQKQVWSHAWCRSCSTANFDDRTQEEHSSLPSPSNLHSMHANLHQMVSSSRKSRRQYVSLRGTMSRSPRCSFSCRSATWICEEGKVSGVRQRCI